MLKCLRKLLLRDQRKQPTNLSASGKYTRWNVESSLMKINGSRFFINTQASLFHCFQSKRCQYCKLQKKNKLIYGGQPSVGFEKCIDARSSKE